MLTIYTHVCTCIRIMTFYITRIMSYIYTCLLELKLTPAAYCKSIPCFFFLIILYFYTILYDTCLLLHHIYEKNKVRTAHMGHLHNPYCIMTIRLTRGHPSSRCRFSFEHTKILRITQFFQWYHTI